MYAAVLLAYVALANPVYWIGGAEAVGTFELVRSLDGVFFLFFTALYHHLRHVAARSFEAFRPMLGVSTDASERAAYELIHLPRGLGWVALVLGLVVGAQSVLFDPASLGLDGTTTALPYVVAFVALTYTVASLAALIFQTLRQLLVVGRLHREAANIDLFHLRPAHAFGTLTARAGMGLALFIAYNVLLQEVTGDAGAPAYAMIVAGVLAVAVFTLPLLGMQARLKREKARLLGRSDEAIKTTIAAIHERVAGDRHGDVGELNTSLNALITTRKLVAGLSTWPWETDTLRSFFSTLLLPILLWLVTRFLGRLV